MQGASDQGAFNSKFGSACKTKMYEYVKMCYKLPVFRIWIKKNRSARRGKPLTKASITTYRLTEVRLFTS